MLKNWKTTLCGVLMAAGAYLALSENPTTKLVGQAIVVIAPVLFGAVAKDKNVTGGTVAQTGEAKNRVN